MKEHARIQNVMSEDVQLRQCFFILIFLVDEGRREDPNTTKLCFADAPLIAQHYMLAWYICSFVIFQGIRTSIAK